jgi:iron complex outermembrane receptor protein
MRVRHYTAALMAGRAALAIGMVTGASTAIAQVANENQSSANPAPAEDQAAAQAGDVNNPGPGNAPQADSGGGAEQIIVTAQFREQNLQDTPLAITAVSSAMLEARSQTNVQDVANQAPSVTLKPQGATFGPSLGASIRGVGQFDFNPALEPGVGLYVDDVYFATLTGSILDLLDLDRVEILRGPQGTLAGRNSIGGAIKLYSQRPTGDNSGYVAAAYGSRNRLDLRGSADFNLAEGLDARIAGVAKQQEGYVKRLDFGCLYPAGGPATFVDRSGATVPINPAGGVTPLTNASDCVLAKEGEVGFIAVRGQLRYRPTDTLDINIIADYSEDDRTAAGPTPRARRLRVPCRATSSPSPRRCHTTSASSAVRIATSAPSTCRRMAPTVPRPPTGAYASKGGACRARLSGT